jgi:hypothetical protein
MWGSDGAGYVDVSLMGGKAVWTDTNLEDGHSMFIRNVSIYLEVHKV